MDPWALLLIIWLGVAPLLVLAAILVNLVTNNTTSHRISESVKNGFPR